MFLILLLRVKDKKRKSRYVCIVTLSWEIQSIFSHHFELFRPTVHLRTLVQITLIRNISKKLSYPRNAKGWKEWKSIKTHKEMSIITRFLNQHLFSTPIALRLTIKFPNFPNLGDLASQFQRIFVQILLKFWSFEPMNTE